jgi:hypothetical protein
VLDEGFFFKAGGSHVNLVSENHLGRQFFVVVLTLCAVAFGSLFMWIIVAFGNPSVTTLAAFKILVYK